MKVGSRARKPTTTTTTTTVIFPLVVLLVSSIVVDAASSTPTSSVSISSSSSSLSDVNALSQSRGGGGIGGLWTKDENNNKDKNNIVPPTPQNKNLWNHLIGGGGGNTKTKKKTKMNGTSSSSSSSGTTTTSSSASTKSTATKKDGKTKMKIQSIVSTPQPTTDKTSTTTSTSSTSSTTTTTAATMFVPPPPDHFVKDTKEKFASDTAKVLKELRGDNYDPTVPSMFHAAKRPTFAVTWTHEMWESHTSRWRFINHFLYWHQSALLKRVLPQLTVLMVWTYGAIQIVEQRKTFLSNIRLPMTSLSLVSGFVGSLLALRSNQGLSRLMEARQAFGKVVFYTRDLSSIIRYFVYSKEPTLALKLARHLSLFTWLLKNFLRGTKVSGTEEDLVRTMLPKADADYVLNQRKKPVAVVLRLRQALHHLSESHKLTTAEELAIDHTIQAMDQSIMLTERIVASPIPPLFTTHAGRLLCFYLFFLPLALHSSGSLNPIGTFVTVLAVGYAMLGLDEISHLMEQPFRLTPLYHLCKKTMRDVADTFCIDPPALDDTKNHHYHPSTPQPYWTNDIDQHDCFE